MKCSQIPNSWTHHKIIIALIPTTRELIVLRSCQFHRDIHMECSQIPGSWTLHAIIIALISTTSEPILLRSRQFHRDIHTECSQIPGSWILQAIIIDLIPTTREPILLRYSHGMFTDARLMNPSCNHYSRNTNYKVTNNMKIMTISKQYSQIPGSYFLNDTICIIKIIFEPPAFFTFSVLVSATN